MNRVGDVGGSRGQATRRGHADADGCHDERGPRREGRQNESGDGGDGPRHAGHASAHAGGDRFLVKAVGGVRQLQQLQDALLQRAPPLVEEAHKETRRHVDAIGCLFHHSAMRRVDISFKKLCH